MPRKSKETPKTLTIGFFGDGEMSAKAFEKAMNEFTEEYTDGVTCIIPVTEDLFTDNIKAVAEWCAGWEEGVDLVVVHDEAAEKKRALKPFISDATKAYKIAGVGNKIVALLKAVDQSESDVVFAGFWVNTEDQVDEDADLEALAEKASDGDIVVRVVNNDFDVVEFDDDGDEGSGDDDADGSAEDGFDGSGGDAAADDADGDDDPYTEENLGEYEIKDLKGILSDPPPDGFGRPLPEGRVRGTTLIKLILQAQEEDAAKGSASPAVVAEQVDGAVVGALSDDIVAQVAEAVATAVATANAEAFNEVLQSIEEKLDTIIEGISTIQSTSSAPAEPVDVEEAPSAPAATGTLRRRRPSGK